MNRRVHNSKVIRQSIMLFVGLTLSIVAMAYVAIANGHDISHENRPVEYNGPIKTDYSPADPCGLSFVSCIETKREKRAMIVSAYTASIYETDQTPCLTADGTEICVSGEAVAANNCLPFGTMVKVNGIGYIIHDRMNARYDCQYLDILFPDRVSALKFGRQKIFVEIIL